jgi:hypothetical protein
MLPPAQHVAMPGGTTGKQGNVLEVAHERIGFVSLAIALIWSSFVSALADRARGLHGSQCGSTPCRTDCNARESRSPRKRSLRSGGHLKDGGAEAARSSIPCLFGTIHPDGELQTTNRSYPKHVIIILFRRRLIGSPQPQPQAPPPWRWRRSGASPGACSLQFLVPESPRLAAPAAA